MKKIGLLIPTLNKGGAERVVSRLSKILSEDYEIKVIVFEDTYMIYEYTGELINLNIKSEKNFLKKCILPFKRAFKLKKIKKDENLECVISFMETPNIVNILSKVDKCKCIISVRNFIDLEKELSAVNKVICKSVKYLYKRADKVVAVSKVIEKNLIKNYGVEDDKCTTIYNPYDLDEVSALASERIDTKHMEFMNSEKIFITVGRGMYQKGHWHLIKAFKYVHERDAKSKLVIIGELENEEKYKRLIKELGVEKSVLLAGYQKNPFKYIKNSNIYVLSSLFEGFPNALVEAMSCGVPVIAADCESGPREILSEKFQEKKIEDFNKERYGVLVNKLSTEEDWTKSIEKTEENLAKSMLEMGIDLSLQSYYSKQSILRAREFNFKRCKLAFIKCIEES